MIRFVAPVRSFLNRALYRSGLGMSLMLLTTLLMFGCGSDQDTNTAATPGTTPINTAQSSPSAPPKVVNKEGNYITANPNPAQFTGKTGKTTITWGTQGLPGMDVHIFVYDGSGKEVGMFATGSVGSQEAPWISMPTEFRLTLGNGPDKKTLDSVVVKPQ